MSFESKIKKWTQALRNIDEPFQRAMLDNETEIIDANVAQLEIGQDALGNLLDEYASDAYAQFKKSMGSKAPMGVPDLKLEGDFHSGFILKRDGDMFFITSTDEKKDRLRDKYGEDIFGLSAESITTLKPDILVSFLKHFRDELR